MADMDEEESGHRGAAADVADGVDEDSSLHLNSWVQEIYTGLKI